jgi:threonine-phosphate decarboxylase
MMEHLLAIIIDIDVLFLCQPNNPTGTALSQEELYDVLKIAENAGYYVSPSVVNFYLLRKPGQQTEELMHDMLKAGFVPRHTSNFFGLEGKYLRLAVRTKEENERLLHFLVRWKQ